MMELLVLLVSVLQAHESQYLTGLLRCSRLLLAVAAQERR